MGLEAGRWFGAIACAVLLLVVLGAGAAWWGGRVMAALRPRGPVCLRMC